MRCHVFFCFFMLLTYSVALSFLEIRSFFVAQDGLRLSISLSQPLVCWIIVMYLYCVSWLFVWLHDSQTRTI